MTLFVDFFYQKTFFVLFHLMFLLLFEALFVLYFVGVFPPRRGRDCKKSRLTGSSIMFGDLPFDPLLGTTFIQHFLFGGKG